MWTHVQPTDAQNEQVKKILNAKLEDFPLLNDLVPRDKNFNINQVLQQLQDKDSNGTLKGKPIWFVIIMYFPSFYERLYPCHYPDAPSLSSSLSSNIDYESFPDHKQFVLSQWKYVLELVVCNCESVESFCDVVKKSFQRHQPIPFLDSYGSMVRRVLGDTVFFFGRSMNYKLHGDVLRSYGTDFEILLHGKPAIVASYANLTYATEDTFGTIMIGESVTESVESWFERLQAQNFEIEINLDTGLCSVGIGSLHRLICYQILSKSKLGYISDARSHIFTTIVGLNQGVISVKLDVTISTHKYDDNPQMYPPVALMVAKYAEVRRMNPEDYKEEMNKYHEAGVAWASKLFLDIHFCGTRVQELFEDIKRKQFAKQSKIFKHTNIYLKLSEVQIIQRRLNRSSVILYVPKKFLGPDMPLLGDIPGDSVIVKVFDVELFFLTQKFLCSPPIFTELFGGFFYQPNIINSRRVRDYNQNHSFKINTITKIYSGFYSFWKDDKKPNDSDNYIAAGMVVFMKRLTQKPKTRRDFLKGLKQLLMMAEALGDDTQLDISYDNMFMDNGKFVFCSQTRVPFPYDNSEQTTKVPSVKRPCIQNPSFEVELVQNFWEVWCTKDSGITGTFVEENVTRFMDEIKKETFKTESNIEDAAQKEIDICEFDSAT